MRARSVPLFVLVTSVFCCLGSVSAQRATLGPDNGDAGTGGKYVIQGSVYYPSGKRVDRPIRVRLSTMTRGDMTTTTDDIGTFWFRRLAPGTYTVVIDAEKEYEPVNEKVNIIQVMSRSANSPEEVISVQIRLRLLVESHKPEVVNVEFASVPQRAVQFYNEALELGRAGKSKSAIDKLNKAIAEYSNFTLAFNELGVQYMRLGELEKANEALQTALKIAPDSFIALQNRGIVLAMLTRYEEAVTELSHAVRLKEQSATAHLYLGQALANLRQFQEAEEHLMRSVALGGDEVKDAHRFLGAIYLQRGDRQRAATEFEIYLRLSPTAKDGDQIRQLLRQIKP